MVCEGLGGESSYDAQFGAQAGVTWAEGIVVREPVLRPTILKEATIT